MNIYRIIFIFLVVLFFFEDKLLKFKKEYKIFKILSVFILILLVGLRGNIARDSGMYIQFFNKCPSLLEINLEYFKSVRFEYGYIFLNSFIKLFTENYNYLFLTVAIISFINLYVFINYFSNSFFYPLALYYARWMFLREFTQMRNGLGYSFFLLALTYIQKNKIKKAILLILIGGAFHKSIYFCLTFIIFKYLLDKKVIKEWFVIIAIYIFPFINLKKWLNIIFVNLLGNSYVVRGYVLGRYSTSKTDIFVYYSLVFLAILLFVNKEIIKREINKNYDLLKKSYLYSLFVMTLFFDYGDLRGRLSSFFNTEFVLQEKIYSLIKYRALVKVLLIIYLILIYYVVFTRRYEQEYLPYFNF